MIRGRINDELGIGIIGILAGTVVLALGGQWDLDMDVGHVGLD